MTAYELFAATTDLAHRKQHLLCRRGGEKWHFGIGQGLQGLFHHVRTRIRARGEIGAARISGVAAVAVGMWKELIEGELGFQHTLTFPTCGARSGEPRGNRPSGLGLS
jgi:hypothetical protein